MVQKLIPEKFRFLSGSMLKVIAVVTMIVDHIASHFIDPHYLLCSVWGLDITLYGLMRGIGRWAFPIFAFLMIEGFLHTRNRFRYGASIFIFALVSEVPWNLAHAGKWTCPSQNVFFCLFLGYLGFCVLEYMKKHPFLQTGALILLSLLAIALRVDFSYYGFAFIVILYLLRTHETARPLTALLLNNRWWSMSAFIPISFYNGKRGFIKGPVLKYIFYAIYPLHFLVIYYVKYVMMAQ